MIIHTYDPKKRKQVVAGELIGNYFMKTIGKDHFMIKEKGFGIQEDVLQTLQEAGCERIIVKTKKFIYGTSLENWMKQPIRNYGHGKQKFISVKKLEVLR
ncbi:MAG: hypothetical protein ACTSPD_09990 [Promethearchaeota archaeon]